MESKVLKVCIVIVLIHIMVAKETTREAEGYPNGYFSECPGVTKPAKITKRSLRHLALAHVSPGNPLTEYNYFNMKNLAKKLDFRKETVIFMTGYLDSTRVNPSSAAFGSFYTERGFNALLVEYVQFVAEIYPVAVRLLRPIGERIAEMLKELTHYGLDPKKVHLLGISLGGQGISFIGKHYREITGRNLSRITALDPAGPCFRRLGPEHRIDASDADMVDVIHTNNEGYGFAGAVGQVDFYVNGGEFQVLDVMPEIPCTMLCSHVKSVSTWIASLIYPDKFVAIQCDSIQDARDRNCFDRPKVINLLGPKTDFSRPGIYYIQTVNTFPYFMGEKGIKREVNFQDDYIKNLNKDDLLEV